MGDAKGHPAIGAILGLLLGPIGLLLIYCMPDEAGSFLWGAMFAIRPIASRSREENITFVVFFLPCHDVRRIRFVMVVTVTHRKRKVKLGARITVTAAAEILGVHRVHLSYVIHGHRKSPRLIARYHDLLSRKPGPISQ